MSVFIKYNGSPGNVVKIQLVFTGFNQISMFLAYTTQTFSIDKVHERVVLHNVMESA